MSNVPSTISIDGVEYVRADSMNGQPLPTEWRIVIGQRGHVFVGRWHSDTSEVVLYDAKVIRIWGTTKGLGELALNGPTSKTVLDEAGTVRLHPFSIVATLDTKVAAAKWAK